MPVKLILLLTLLTALQSCNQQRQHHDTPNNIDELLDECRIRFVTNDRDSTSYQLADSLFKNVKLNDIQKARYYDFVCTVRKHRLQFDRKTIALADSVIALTEKYRNNPSAMRLNAEGLLTKGQVYDKMGNYRVAYHYLHEARKSGEQFVSGERKFAVIANYDYLIGMIYFRQEKYRDAAESFKNSYLNFQKTKKEFPTVQKKEELLNNIGLSYFKMSMYDSAIYYYDSALHYIKKVKGQKRVTDKFYEMAYGIIKGNLAVSYYHKNDTARAIQGLLENININIQPGYDNGDAIASLIHLAGIYLDKKQPQNAIAYIRLAETTNPGLLNTSVMRNIYKLKWQYYAQLKQMDSANQNAIKYTELTENLNLAARSLMNADVQGIMDQMENEKQLATLKSDLSLKSSYNTFITIIVVLCLLVVVLQMFVSRNLRAKNLQLHTLNEEAKRTNEMLNQLNQDKNRIMAIAAHDLRNPVSAIASINNLLKSYLPEDSADALELSDMIKTGCSTALYLIDDILVLSSIQHQQADFLKKKEPVAVNQFLKTTIGLLSFKAEEKQIRLHIDYLEKDLQIVIAVENFRRVINNIIVNAIKFSHPNQDVYIQARKAAPDKVQFVIKDHGIGIPEHMASQIFDVFTKAKRPGTQGESAFGLGLSISKQITEMHGGKLWFTSKPNEETVFYVELPIS